MKMGFVSATLRDGDYQRMHQLLPLPLLCNWMVLLSQTELILRHLLYHQKHHLDNVQFASQGRSAYHLLYARRVSARKFVKH